MQGLNNFREPICRSEMVLTARVAEKLRRKLQRLPMAATCVADSCRCRVNAKRVACFWRRRTMRRRASDCGGNCAVKQMKTWNCRFLGYLFNFLCSRHVFSGCSSHACHRLAQSAISSACCEFRTALSSSCNISFRHGRQINVRPSQP